MADYGQNCESCGGWLKHKEDCNRIYGGKAMGSGEADAIRVTVEADTAAEKDRMPRRHQTTNSMNNALNQLNHAYVNTSSSTTSGPLSGTLGFVETYPSTTWPYSYSWPNTQYIYMYQIRCPRCSTMNFAQLEVVTPCKKCKSKLKATQQKVDYEVPVEL